MPNQQWIAAYFHKSQIDIWLMRGEGAPKAQQTVAYQHKDTPPDEIPYAMRAAIAKWLPDDGEIEIVIAGHFGAVSHETLRQVPCTPLSIDGGVSKTRHLYVVPWIRQSRPVAYSYGAEILAAGYLRNAPDYDGILILSDEEETTWLHLSAGEIVSFRSFATPLTYHALSPDVSPAPALRHEAIPQMFLDTVSECLSQPEQMLLRIAEARAEMIAQRCPVDQAQQRGMGAIIGAELAATRFYWLGQQIVVTGVSSLTEGYVAALRHQGASVLPTEFTDIAVSGLIAAYQSASS